MSTTETTRRYTPDDLLTMPDGDRYEIVDGELVEREMSGLSSLVATTVNRFIGNHVESHSAGYVFGADCGYQCYPFDSGKLRRPDGSFIRAGRVSLVELESGYITVAPDLAIEAVSPKNLVYELNRKVVEYLRAGVRLVWVFDPQMRTVAVHRPDGTDNRLHDDGELSGEGCVAGFPVPRSGVVSRTRSRRRSVNQVFGIENACHGRSPGCDPESFLMALQ